MILFWIAAILAALTLLTAWICYRIGFYSPPRKPLPEGFIDTPEGEIYEPFHPQMRQCGARTASHGIQADVAISIDTTAASDTFESMMDQMVCLGKGPGIKAMDFSFISSVAVRRKLQQVAKANNIPYQLEVFTGIGTDAGEMHMAHKGVPTGSVSVPSRNAHTALEVIDLQDMDYAKDLLAQFIYALNDKDEFKFVK